MSTIATNVPTSLYDLRRVISDVESNTRYDAIRFERGTFNKITDKGTTPLVMAIAKANNCSTDTARMIYSSSWGAFQIMGFNIYDKASVGYTGAICNFLYNRDTQNNAFRDFVVSKGINVSVDSLKDETNRNAFSIKYNGSTAYGDRVLAAMKRLGLA